MVSRGSKYVAGLYMTSTSYSSLKAPEHRELLEVLGWTLRSTDMFFRGLYQHGVWIPSPIAAGIVRHGWAMTDTSLQSSIFMV